MQLLKTKILEEGQALSDSILKVDSFLNHRMDPVLMHEMGKEFKRRFQEEKIDVVLTIESSGIGPGVMAALELGVPMIFARKRKSVTLTDDLITANVYSFTKKEANEIAVSNKFISSGDRVLIIDDFLANGQAALGLMEICHKVNATVVGIGIVIEKAFQDGGAKLREQGVRVESLAKIEALSLGEITFVEEREDAIHE
ncbi:xanthine phosphoribosyltransferase [Peribacillus loiseleuriae]|uniref:Xanthine phosphoribosyltransferase n=1 Tax=Peribacillus loiseleuriae TaxID=1679170 RepID=A0A0K9GWD2_9BACI|nr:xanthine phosphoribosyltransferase [Peribacillus loiseleuriae]KMY50562.1 xanthine phosphoribosyltransferase [Peribacillus loiseleuriae]